MNTLVSIIENAYRSVPEKGIVHVTHGKEDYFQSYEDLYTKGKATAFILREKGFMPGDFLILSVEMEIPSNVTPFSQFKVTPPSCFSKRGHFEFVFEFGKHLF